VTRNLAFRTRLMLAYSAIVAAAVILLGSIAFITVHVALDTAFRTRLDTTAKAMRSTVDVRGGRLQEMHSEDLIQFEQLLGQGLNGAALRRDGSLMVSNLASPPIAILESIAKVTASTEDPIYVDKGSALYVVLPIIENGVRYGTIVAWESRGVYDDMERITILGLAVAGIVVIVAAAAMGGALTGHMLKPVTVMSALMSDIEATSLGERLAWDGADDELGRLCVTFDKLLDRLETAFARERRFIADASHELRTPLSVMRAEVELAMMHDRSPEGYRSALARLQRETQRLETLAQSLILTTRDHSRSMPLLPVATRNVATRAAERMQPLAVSRHITLTSTSETDASVMADADMLERAIVALIDNALRFARKTVAVMVESDGSDVRISVGDDGPGFSDDALIQATARFWRDDPARSGNGTGLGLAIARTIVERHNGTIVLRNASSGAGAIVDLTLPLLRTAAL
jgi:two-component system OmpR family sensor kinase